MGVRTLPALTVGAGTSTVYYPAYKFEGDWDPGDQVLIEAVMRECVPVDMPAVYDTWRLLCFQGRFIATRLTWETGHGIYAQDVWELRRLLLGYYGKG